jgi:putative FmdB family regulatory protein
MPTYEFRCPAGHDFERFYRKISDSVAELPCPECGDTAVRRMSGGAGLMFKGSGFYLTDYGKNAHRTGGSKSEASSGEGKPGGSASDAPASGGSGSGGEGSRSGGEGSGRARSGAPSPGSSGSGSGDSASGGGGGESSSKPKPAGGSDS